MPTAIEYFGFSVTNVGPLTTTFTAAESCATVFNNVAYADQRNPSQFFGAPTCGWTPYGESCYPHGDKYDSLALAKEATATQGFLPYFSPGLACPSGWTTAGTAAHPSASGTMVVDGILAEDLWPWDNREGSSIVAVGIPELMALMDVLEAGETLALCCPNSYTANIGGNCFSSVGPFASFSFTGPCFDTIPVTNIVFVTSFDGSTWVPALMSLTPVTTETSGRRTEIIKPTATVGIYASTFAKDIAIITMIPGVPLIWREEDRPAAATSSSSAALASTSGDAEASESAGANGSGGTGDLTSDSAAVAIRLASAGLVFMPLCIMVVAVLAEAGLVIRF